MSTDDNNCVIRIKKKFLKFLKRYFELDISEETEEKKYQGLITFQPKSIEISTNDFYNYFRIELDKDEQRYQTEISSYDGFELL